MVTKQKIPSQEHRSMEAVEVTLVGLGKNEKKVEIVV